MTTQAGQRFGLNLFTDAAQPQAGSIVFDRSDFFQSFAAAKNSQAE
jgi:hypothetical protein